MNAELIKEELECRTIDFLLTCDDKTWEMARENEKVGFNWANGQQKWTDIISSIDNSELVEIAFRARKVAYGIRFQPFAIEKIDDHFKKITNDKLIELRDWVSDGPNGKPNLNASIHEVLTELFVHHRPALHERVRTKIRDTLTERKLDLKKWS